MGLFEKKFCDVCGEKIKLLGNRKLEDGNLCKSCASQLSPWFDERRHSTVAAIKEQLDYREKNKAEVSSFTSTRTFGDGTRICIDDNQKKFLVAQTSRLGEENPDVLAFSDVTGVDIDIDEDRNEEMDTIKKDDGTTEQVSFNPPRYTYDYNFYVQIRVNNPYFDDIRFRLNREEITIDPNTMPTFQSDMGGDLLGSVVQGLASAVMNASSDMSMQSTNTDSRMRNPDYARYVNMADEIREALLNVRDTAAVAAAPKAAVTCPLCGATTTPDENGRCEYCGGAIGA